MKRYDPLQNLEAGHIIRKPNQMIKQFMRSFSVISAISLVIFGYATVFADEGLAVRSLTLADPVIGATTSYTLSFNTQNNFTIGSIALEICDEDPIPNSQPCTSPHGFSALNYQLANQSGISGLTNNSNSNINHIVIGRPPQNQNPSNISLQFNNITNPSSNRTYYARVYIYASNDGTGIELENGGIAFSINKKLAISTEVPPYLKFCVGKTIPIYDCASATSSMLDFGEFSSKSTKAAQHQMLVATNAGYGFNITYFGTSLTSGNNVIPAMSSISPSSTGQGQFGFNLRANSQPSSGQDPVGPGASVVIAPNYNIPNRYIFQTGDKIISSVTTTDYYKLTANYVVNIASTQPPGNYTSTIFYICLANF